MQKLKLLNINDVEMGDVFQTFPRPCMVSVLEHVEF